MDVHNCSLIIHNSANTENKYKKISSGKNSRENEPSLSSEFPNILKTFMEDDRENITDRISRVNLHSAEHRPRSRIRNCKPSDPFHVHNCKDRLPSLETEQQFRIAITRCARGGDSVERNPSNSKFSDGMRVTPNVLSLPPLIFKTKPVVISSSPMMTDFSATAKSVESRRTVGVDTSFTHLSTPKYIKGKVRKDKKIGDCVQQMRCNATKGLHVKCAVP
ncbi:Adhesion cell surface protein [Dirofilaria immitis]